MPSRIVSLIARIVKQACDALLGWTAWTVHETLLA
jgi:hypothetical protein